MNFVLRLAVSRQLVQCCHNHETGVRIAFARSVGLLAAELVGEFAAVSADCVGQFVEPMGAELVHAKTDLVRKQLMGLKKFSVDPRLL